MLSINGLYIADPSIFDYFYLPTELEESKQDIIDYICESCAELEIVYPDPNIMKNSIRIWSSRNLYKWSELYKTTQYEYNPIWNKDGTFTETHNDMTTTNSTATRQTTGYNDNNFVDRDKDTIGGSVGVTGGYTRTERGNVGITSTQSLIAEQRDIVRFSIIEEIAKDFRNYYCLMVW